MCFTGSAQSFVNGGGVLPDKLRSDTVWFSFLLCLLTWRSLNIDTYLQTAS